MYLTIGLKYYSVFPSARELHLISIEQRGFISEAEGKYQNGTKRAKIEGHGGLRETPTVHRCKVPGNFIDSSEDCFCIWGIQKCSQKKICLLLLLFSRIFLLLIKWRLLLLLLLLLPIRHTFLSLLAQVKLLISDSCSAWTWLTLLFLFLGFVWIKNS